ncbi:MAG: methyltransferase domain-containing protein [Oscillospiraceae bacterium]|nr:methyltransferase domain-containing protein [Oscillospiraceae bacterium]
MDVIKQDHIDFVGDACDLSFLDDSSIDEIYACHVLEHFKRHEICNVLKEWCRVLKRGGVLRLAVPNFSAICVEYKQCGNLDLVLGLLYGGQDYEYNFHYQVYDFDRIKRLLEDTGFHDVQEYDWKEFLPDGYDDFSRAYLPHMDFENGRLMSLNVKTVKGLPYA